MEGRPFSDHSYEQFLNEEKLMGSQCRKCGALFAPPRPICTTCYGTEMEWVQMSGKGKLHAFTCVAIGPPFMVDEGYDRDHPYCSGVVQLEEGPRVDARDPADVLVERLVPESGEAQGQDEVGAFGVLPPQLLPRLDVENDE